MTDKTYYVTTAIDYPNGNPHIGHAFEKIIADVLARWKRINGYDVFFLTGTDENGQKLQDAAEAKKLEPQKFVDQMVNNFVKFAKVLNISNDFFVRTTADYHKKKCVEIFQKVLDKGEIYKGTYKGWHCVPCETYYTEKDLVDGNCPKCGRSVKLLEEEAYFFKLSKYQNPLIEYIKNNNFIYPEFRRNEILSRLENDELRDLCVSRSGIKWGITLPNDSEHVIYVWFDALINYISGLRDHEELYWPADVHVIGKDIIWFHTVIWPGMLLAADISLPKQVYAHGFVNDKNGEKMSKSKGNVVDPLTIVKRYGNDVLRYYFLRSTPAGQDCSFSEEELLERYNSELANEFGNLITRNAVLVEKYFDGKVPKAVYEELFDCSEVLGRLNEFVDKYEFNHALDEIWATIKLVNKYINEKEPWKVTDKDELAKIVYTVIDSIRLLCIILYPFIPESIEKVRKQYNLEDSEINEFKWGLTKEGIKIVKGDILFPKQEILINEKGSEENKFPLNLKVGKIKEAKQHPNADKLLILKVDIGNEIQLVAGIKEYYDIDELLGKKIIVVSNLKPAKLRGEESQGMLLAADIDDKVELLTCDDSVGSIIKVTGLENNDKIIDFSEFQKVKLTVKHKKVYYCDKQLKSDKAEVIVDINDGAKIR